MLGRGRECGRILHDLFKDLSMYRGSSHSSPFSPLPRLSPVILLQAWKHFIPPLIFHHALHSCLNFHFLSLTHTHSCMYYSFNELFIMPSSFIILCVCVCVCVCVRHSVVSDSLWSMDCILVGSSVHRILQARILEWVAIPFFRGSSWHPTPVLLPGKSHGRRSLVGCRPWGR